MESNYTIPLAVGVRLFDERMTKEEGVCVYVYVQCSADVPHTGFIHMSLFCRCASQVCVLSVQDTSHQSVALPPSRDCCCSTTIKKKAEEDADEEVGDSTPAETGSTALVRTPRRPLWLVRTRYLSWLGPG